MLRYDKNELTRVYNSNDRAAGVEIYRYAGERKTMHTDFVNSIPGVVDIEDLPDREFELDYEWMDEADYSDFMANDADFQEWYGDKNAQVLVIVFANCESPELSNLDNFLWHYDGDTDVVETASEANGYPAHISKAVILPDVEDFDELKAIADEWGLSLINLDKRSGWNMWHRGDITHWPLDLASHYRNDDNCEVVDYIDDEQEFMEQFAHRLEGLTSLEEAQVVLNDLRSLWDGMQEYGDEYQFVLRYGGFEKAIHIRPVSDDDDSRQDQIALVDISE